LVGLLIASRKRNQPAGLPNSNQQAMNPRYF
jgi:hypothetical protein